MARKQQTGTLVKLPLSAARAALAASAPIVALAPLLLACGPAKVGLDPRNVVDVQVRPASGQRLFCPGDPFQVELVAKLNDGSACSSTDRSRGCMGEKDAVINPQDVRIEMPGGGRKGPPEQFVWVPPSDPLATADTGVQLRGWIEKIIAGQLHRSMVGETELKPVYQCRMSGEFWPPSGGNPGANGAAGPDVTVAITTLSTPYYPAGALIRVQTMGSTHYYISPSAEQAVRIASRGQDGLPGASGAPGTPGEKGQDAPSDAAACTKGGRGGRGGDGGPGGRGGDGGPGGTIRILLDDAAADKLRGRIVAESTGGGPGPGGSGGDGGRGGDGGAGGPTNDQCTDTTGEAGKPGKPGPSGAPGRAGPAGPPPVISTASRQELFAAEMPAITRIEAAKGKPQ